MATSTLDTHQPEHDSKHAYDLMMAQQATGRFRADLYRLSPKLDGVLLEDVVLNAFDANDIPHGLGREVRGWEVVKESAPRCSFSAYDSTGTTVGIGSTVIVPVDSKTYDWGDDFDTSSNRFVAPVKGEYAFTGNALALNVPDGGTIYSTIKINGVLHSHGSMVASGAAANAMSVVSIPTVRLSAGDYAELFIVYGTGSGTLTVPASTGPFGYFKGGLVDRLFDGQNDADHPGISERLRLYSTMARTVSLWVW